MKLLRASFLILSLLLSTTAFAVLPKESQQGAAGACTAVAGLDTTTSSLVWTNVTNAVVNVNCTPRTDSSEQGTATFGAVISNLQANNRVVQCTAEINSGGNGRVFITRNVFVGPNQSKRITWTAADMGWNKTFIGGQAGMKCSLLPATGIQWIFTTSVGN